MTITVLPNQNLLDVAIQHTGSVLNAFIIALANGMAVSDIIKVNQVLFIPETDQITSVFNTYKKEKIEPATSITSLQEIEEKGGIGIMKVASTFRID